MKYFKKIILLILIQAFLVVNTASAGGLELALEKAIKSTLSPQIAIDHNAFKRSYSIYARKRFLTKEVVLPQGVISFSDIIKNGTIINNKTTNFKIGENSFRVPPYLAGRVARLHVTAINQNGFEFQKMGIGVGRRKKTIAVVLVDLDNPENQLLVFGQDDTALLKALDEAVPEETIALGNKALFDAMARQDSFLERSDLGIDFLNRVLGIGQLKFTKPREVAAALKNLAISNPKLEKELPVSLAFFSQDYMLTFSEGLKKHSHVAVLRDREQRGRFIAIIDRLNPDNRVIFERRGEQVYILGKNERVIIPKLKKHKKTQVIYFTDIEEGARFCRNVTRSLVEIDFSAKSHSISIRKKVQLNVGAYNPDVSVLKVKQVTQSTVTGYQVKKRAPEFMEEDLAAYPVYILRNNFRHEVSVADVEIDYESGDFIFFKTEDIEKCPHYLSFGNAENAVYYQHLKGTYSYERQDYAVYRAITKDDILTSLSFSNDGSFTIRGINWKDGNPVVFSNVKNIALPNIVTQLNASKFIDIDPVLDKYFNITELKISLNPVRSAYKFKNGVFEQGENIKMKGLIDFTEIQEKEDKKIQKIKKFTKADDELLDNIQSDIREECLNNDLIQVFFNFEKNKDFGNPFYPIIKQLLFSEDEIIKEIIEEVEDRGETKIEAEGREILEDFNNMPANEKAEKAHTWAEFVTQRTMGEYDLTQIFAHSFSLAQGWLQLLKSDKYYEFIAKAEKGFNENFRKGYVVLRAIAIESRKQSGLIAYKQIMQSKILSDFFCRDQKEEKKRLVGYIRELLASDNDIVRNIIKQVDANPKEWISGQAAQLLEAFNANQAYEDYDKVHTWAELAAIQTTGAYDLYQLLVHIINAAYLNMEALEKLSPEDKYYAETREALEKTLRNGYIILRAIEIASRDFVDFQDRSDVARINDVDFKEMRDFGDKDKYILKKLKERENIIVKRQLQPGKNASIYVAEHPGFGEVIIKILPYEIGLNYGVEERFEIASYFAKAYKSLSPFPNVLKFISFEKIGSAVIIEEFIEEFTREQMKAILTREGIKDSGVVEKTLRYIELESLLRIWLKSFELDKYKGLVIRDIMPQDIRYVKINGQWMAKFLDSEERGFFTTLEKVIAFYSQWEEDYDKGMIAELVSSFFHKEEFRQIIELEKITGNHDVDEFLGRILDPKLQDDFTSSFSQKAVESINCSI